MTISEAVRLSFEVQHLMCQPQTSYNNPDRPLFSATKTVSHPSFAGSNSLHLFLLIPKSHSGGRRRTTPLQASTSGQDPSFPAEEEEFWVYTEEDDDVKWSATNVSRREQLEAEEELLEDERQYTEADLEAVEEEYEELLRQVQRVQDRRNDWSDDENDKVAGSSRTFSEEESANGSVSTKRQSRDNASSSRQRKIVFGGKQWDEPLSMTEGSRKERAPWAEESSPEPFPERPVEKLESRKSDQQQGHQPRRLLSREEARKRDAELMQKRSWWGGGTRGSASLWREEDEFTKGPGGRNGGSVNNQNKASMGKRSGGEREDDASLWEERKQPADTLQKEELDDIFGSVDTLDSPRASTSGREHESSRSRKQDALSQPSVDKFEQVGTKPAGRRHEGAQGLARVIRMDDSNPFQNLPEHVDSANFLDSNGSSQSSKRKKVRPEVPEGGWTPAETETQTGGTFAERVEHKAFTRKVPEFVKTGGRRGQPERRYGAGGDEWAAREAKWFGDEARFQTKGGDRVEDEDETDGDESVTSRSFSREAGCLPPRTSANQGYRASTNQGFQPTNQGYQSSANQELPGWLQSKAADLDAEELTAREERQRRFYEQQQDLARKKEAKEYHRRGRALLLSKQGTWQKKKRRQDAKRRKKLEYMEMSEKFASEGLKLYKAPSWLDQNKGELDEEPDDLMEEIGRKLEIMGMVPPRAE